MAQPVPRAGLVCQGTRLSQTDHRLLSEKSERSTNVLHDDSQPPPQCHPDFYPRANRRSGPTPSLAEIAEAFGFASRSVARKHVLALTEAGFIEVNPHQARGIRLLDQPARAELLDIPVLGRVAAGRPMDADAEVHSRLLLDPGMFSRTPDYLLRVQGDSMIEDGILDGDLVAVHREAEARNGQIVVARLDGEVTIKRFQRTAEGVRLLPRNPAYEPILVRDDQDLAIEGVFCGLVRQG